MLAGRPVWIDLGNSPHVLFFAPVIAELHRRKVTTVVTARDFAQTVPLCERFGIDAEVIGQHGGGGLGGKAASLGAQAATAMPSDDLGFDTETLAQRHGLREVSRGDYRRRPASV